MSLIVTCARFLESEAEAEIGLVLKEFGDIEPIIHITDMPGILTVETKLDPFTVIRDMRKKVLEEPWHIRYCLRVIPIQKTMMARFDDVKDGIKSIMSGILEEDTYRISIEKRNSNISSQEWILKIASSIPNRVSLEDPDKIILIEIIGEWAGIAIIQINDILSVEKTKRSLSE